MDVDLFGNLVDVGKQATTDTFIIPLRKYPTAESIELRRITGDVKMYDVVLFPVVTSGEPNADALKKLAAVLADPLMIFARRSRAATRCPAVVRLHAMCFPLICRMRGLTRRRARSIMLFMKATLDLPAPLLRKLKAEAAAKGQAIGKLIADKLTTKPKRTPPFRKWTAAGRKLPMNEYRRISEEEAAEMRAVPTVTKVPVVELISSMRR